MKNRVKVEIKVNNIKYFVKDIIKENINIYFIEEKDNKLIMTVDYSDYKKIKKRKTIKKIKIIEYYGINKVLRFIKHYQVLIISILLGIALNLILSNLILKIEIDTPNNQLRSIVEKNLKKYGISKGHLKKDFIANNKIKEKILYEEKDRIEWMEISTKGTKYIVKVIERKQDKQEEDCIPRNIVSKKKAIVKKIESSDGEIIVKVNDYVDQGTILISGFIHNKDEIVAKKCANGKVYGETWYKATISFPQKDSVLKKTKDYSWGVSFYILNYEIVWPRKYALYNKKEYNIFGSNFIKAGLYFIREEKIVDKQVNYKISSIDNIAVKKVVEEINKNFQIKPLILRKKVLKKYENNDRIVVEVFIALEEDITDYQDISEINIEEINKKEE